MEKGIIKCWKGDTVRCTGNEVKRIMNKLRAVLRNLSRRGFWQSKALSNVAWQGCAFTCHWLREMFKKSPAKLHLIFFVCSGCMLHGEKVSPYLTRQYIKCCFSASEADESEGFVLYFTHAPGGWEWDINILTLWMAPLIWSGSTGGS